MENNKMLISVAEEGGIRAAVLRGKFLYDLDIEYPDIEQKKSNIYKGVISRVEPSLGAAFIDYGAERHGFLPVKEISKNYFTPGYRGDFSNINIRDVVREGQELIVQIEKEERGNKGAALTTFISLAGSYVVLMPNNPRAGGISRRIEGADRDDMRESLRDLRLPEDMGVIVRTAGISKSGAELQRDLDMLLQLWTAITQANNTRPAPFLIYQESDTAICAVRDYLKESLSEILIDSREIYEKVKNYIQLVRPDFIHKIKFYAEKTPLFSYYHIEKQIESAYQRVITLPSGGSIVFDYTEALVSIDVNSARATGGSGIEETALNTNLEASDEIARQLRLRDIGGLIVIDFIDMDIARNQREVGQRLRDALKHDRARVQVGNISRFGLLEMSRQRLHPRLGEAIQVTCPRCDGQGTIRSIESLANSIIHLIEEEATREHVIEIHVQVPMDLAAYLLNEKRSSLSRIEGQQRLRVLILPNQHLETPKYKIKSIKSSDTGSASRNGETDTESGSSGVSGNDGIKSKPSSYRLLETPDAATPEKQKQSSIDKEEIPAVVTTFTPTQPASTTSLSTKNSGYKVARTATSAVATTGDETSILKKISCAIKNVFQKKPVVSDNNVPASNVSNRISNRSSSTTSNSSSNVNKRPNNRRRSTASTTATATVTEQNGQRRGTPRGNARYKPGTGTYSSSGSSSRSGDTSNKDVAGTSASFSSKKTGYHAAPQTSSPPRTSRSPKRQTPDGLNMNVPLTSQAGQTPMAPLPPLSLQQTPPSLSSSLLPPLQSAASNAAAPPSPLSRPQQGGTQQQQMQQQAQTQQPPPPQVISLAARQSVAVTSNSASISKNSPDSKNDLQKDISLFYNSESMEQLTAAASPVLASTTETVSSPVSHPTRPASQLMTSPIPIANLQQQEPQKEAVGTTAIKVTATTAETQQKSPSIAPIVAPAPVTKEMIAPQPKAPTYKTHEAETHSAEIHDWQRKITNAALDAIAKAEIKASLEAEFLAKAFAETQTKTEHKTVEPAAESTIKPATIAPTTELAAKPALEQNAEKPAAVNVEVKPIVESQPVESQKTEIKAESQAATETKDDSQT